MKNKRFYFIVILAFIAISVVTLYPLLYGKNSQINHKTASVNNIIEDFKICDINDKCTNLSSYFGNNKYLVVNFGASWCMPCKKEIPEIVSAAKQNNNLNILIISVDHNKEDMLKFLKQSTSLDFSKNPIKNISIHMDSSTKIAGQIFYTNKYPETYILQLIDNKIHIYQKLIGGKHKFNDIFASLK